MGSETPQRVKIPIIDFSIQSVKPETPEWNAGRDQVQEALEEFGCFEAVFDKISLDIRREFIEAVKELFGLPLETKRKVSWSQKNPLNDYVSGTPEAPLFERMSIFEANIHQVVESFTTSLWPQGHPSFCKTIQSYTEQLSGLDQIIRRMILENLGTERHLEEHLGSADYILRVMRYEEPQTTETKLGLKAHTDTSFITILNQNQIEGLQIMTKNGEWNTLRPSQNSFIVLVGDSLHAWSNGRLNSPKHRVMMSGNEARYSAGLFAMPKAGYLVKAPEELIDEEHPLLFNPFDYSKFLEFYMSEAGQKTDTALKAYCGC